MATNPELEKAIEENPGDGNNYLVYADWLSGEGDPRGELIAVQHALPRAGGDEVARLLQREAQLLEEHAGRFFGEGHKLFDWMTVTWHLGFFQSLTVQNTIGFSLGWVASHLERIFAQHSARFLRDLRIGVLGWLQESQTNVPALLELIGVLPIASRIESLTLGRLPEHYDMAHRMLGDLSILSTAFPNLRSLTLHAGHFALGPLELPHLRELTIETCGLRRVDLRRILDEQWPEMEKLALWFGSTDHATATDIAMPDLEPVFDGARFPKLTQLGLMNTELSDAICVRLPSATLMPRLRSLDLSMGTMSDDGARALVADPARVNHLQRLDVRQNMLSWNGGAILRGGLAGPAIDTDEQKSHRYVTVWE